MNLLMGPLCLSFSCKHLTGSQNLYLIEASFFFLEIFLKLFGYICGSCFFHVWESSTLLRAVFIYL